MHLKMLIDNTYILNRYNYFLSKKQESLLKNRDEDNKLYGIKSRFPKWLRSVVFHPFNPFYSVFVQYKNNRQQRPNSYNLQQLQPFAVDMMQYWLTNKIEFDTSFYYPKQDEAEILSFIDNRLMSCIPGYSQQYYTEEQIKMVDERKILSQKVKRTDDGFTLSLDGKEYFLPVNSFDEPTYIHAYGLKYLSDKVLAYMSGKDFLDIGAYLGDTSIFLAKNYDPKHIYAYEPVKKNVEQLSKTIERNNTDKISVIEKGLGEKEEDIDIYIHPEQLSGSSINPLLADKNREKEKVHITTIDRECKDRHVGLLKMDVEGVEYGVVKGGLETIQRDKPVLLISLYHTAKDFFEIPPMLKEIVPEYQFRFMNIEIVNPFSEKILIGYPADLK